MNVKKLMKDYQQSLVLAACYALALSASFTAGRITATYGDPPEIRIEETFVAPLNDTQKQPEAQSEQSTNPGPAKISDCEGKIKGNIGSGGSKIYHVPGGSFYGRVVPELCFATEDEALNQGFRKSLN